MFTLLWLEKGKNMLLGHSYMCVGHFTIFLWEGLICYIIHSLLSCLMMLHFILVSCHRNWI